MGLLSNIISCFLCARPPLPLKTVQMRKSTFVVLAQGDAGELGLPGTIGSSGKTVILLKYIFKMPL